MSCDTIYVPKPECTPPATITTSTVATPSTVPLADTGSDVGAVLPIAGVLLALGIFVGVIARRRRG